MRALQLTDLAKAASIPAMRERDMTGTGGLRRGFRAASMLGVVALAAGLGACVTVKAPDNPIVIELNINIRQEVIYRLVQDADKTITENAEIF